jgi:hypothetical protein
LNPKEYAKAILAALIAGLGSLSVGMQQDGLSAYEIVTSILVFLTAAGVVWGVPNKQPTEEEKGAAK